MRARVLLAVIILSSFVTTTAFGQRTLSPDETRQIFQQLTSQPRSTWLPAGTIQAIHQEYGAPKTRNETEISGEIDKQIQEYKNNPKKRELAEEGQKLKLEAIPFNVRYRLGNEFTMTSQVTVRYDGERFYWEINVDSRQDSVRPDAALAGNFMTEQFDLGFNQKRISVWDGEKYTTYTASGRHAMVDAAGRLPRAVNGPLTAGLIPWGYGPFTYTSLAAAQVTATEVSVGSRPEVQMTLIRGDGSSTKLILDPTKDYAVTACTLPYPDGTIVTYLCSGYQQVGAYWVPSSIAIERQDAGAKKLLRSEQWTLTAVSGDTPSPDSFAVDYPPDTLIEYSSAVTSSPLTYYSYSADTDRLLTERLSFAATQNRQTQNCATAALKLVASRLGKSVSDSSLSRLIGPDHQTSLYAMKQFAQGMGLYCRAVKTDLAALRDLEGVQAILHIPAKHHYVVLGEIDSRCVRLIDLSSNKFYYPQSVHFFPEDWPEGTALLLSDKPIPGRFADLPDRALTAIVGGYWTCTRLYQEEDIIDCGPCPSLYTFYYRRFVCETAPAGSCQGTVFVRYQNCACDWNYMFLCAPSSNWTYYWMRGCEQ